MEPATQNPTQVSKSIINSLKDGFLLQRKYPFIKRRPPKKKQRSKSMVSYSFYDMY